MAFVLFWHTQHRQPLHEILSGDSHIFIRQGQINQVSTTNSPWLFDRLTRQGNDWTWVRLRSWTIHSICILLWRRDYNLGHNGPQSVAAMYHCHPCITAMYHRWSPDTPPDVWLLLQCLCQGESVAVIYLQTFLPLTLTFNFNSILIMLSFRGNDTYRQEFCTTHILKTNFYKIQAKYVLKCQT